LIEHNIQRKKYIGAIKYLSKKKQKQKQKQQKTKNKTIQFFFFIKNIKNIRKKVYNKLILLAKKKRDLVTQILYLFLSCHKCRSRSQPTNQHPIRPIDKGYNL
jgi:hypothetical protein